jgi:hypothetical protein
LVRRARAPEEYLSEIGFTPVLAAWALGAVSVIGIPGQIILGGLSDRVGRERPLPLLLIKKREELRRVRERLQDPDLRPGMERELRKHVEILERGTGELDGK